MTEPKDTEGVEGWKKEFFGLVDFAAKDGVITEPDLIKTWVHFIERALASHEAKVRADLIGLVDEIIDWTKTGDMNHVHELLLALKDTLSNKENV